MQNSVVLNNVDHRDLKINTTKSAEYGDNVNGSLVFPAEFIDIHKEYPIYFQKSPDTGEFQAVAIFGFSENENVFLSESGWDARYLPALIRREPFLIGLQKETSAEKGKSSVIMVDLGSPRISKDSKGQAVFKDSGGNTAFLDDVNQALSIVHEGMPASASMFSTFLELDLIEPLGIDITFNDGSHYKTDMFYTINQETLLTISGEALDHMHRSGLLQIAYMVLESLGNVRSLIDKRNTLSQSTVTTVLPHR